MSRLSVVLPAYNEELMVGKTCRVLHEVLSEAGISYELVVVDDGSKDKTWDEITKAGEKDVNVLGVHFSRNFGKEAAVYAGLAQATGDVVAVMDCDLQHPPETLIPMYHLWEQGWEVIEGVKKSRGTEEVIPADLVLIAAGFLGSQKYVTDAFKVTTTARTNVETKPDAYETSVPRVFTAGDMHRGQSLVVWAIREGREAAKAVDESLMGYSYL